MANAMEDEPMANAMEDELMANAMDDEPALTPKQKKSIYNKKRYQYKKETDPDFLPSHSKRTGVSMNIKKNSSVK